MSGPSGRGPAAFLLLLAAVPSAAGAIEPAVAFDREDLSRLQGGDQRSCRSCDLAGAPLAGADLAGADLAGADLTYAALDRATLRGARLAGADLAEASLERADLEQADLTGASLERVSLASARLAGACLVGARLERANLFRADLRGADLSRVDLAAYQCELTKTRSKVLAWRRSDAPYTPPVAQVWQASVEAAAMDCPAARDLLELLAFLAPEPVPRDLLGSK